MPRSTGAPIAGHPLRMQRVRHPGAPDGAAYRPVSGTNARALFAFMGITSWFAPES
jgi:hypothetical protein